MPSGEIVGALLPVERGRGYRPAQDNRRYSEGMMWAAGSGAPWQRLPDEYCKRNSVFRRYWRWKTTGVSNAMLERLAEALGRSRSGFTTKLHARCDAHGRPLTLVLTPGQAFEADNS